MKSIVVVDDHSSVAQATAVALQSEMKGFKVVGLCEFAAAVAEIARLRPTVAIVDWRLSVSANGTQLIQQSSLTSADTRWLLFTGYPRAYVLEEAIRAGISGCVSKAANYAELAKAVREVVEGRKYYCSESLAVLAQILEKQSVELTEGERQVLRCVAQGKEAKEIADITKLSVKTVHNYLTNVRAKTGRGSMVELAYFAIERGIAPPTP